MSPARVRAAAFLVAGCVLLLPAAGSSGEDAGDAIDLQALREERNEKLERYIVRALTQKRLSVAIELLEDAQYAAAREKLEHLAFPRLNPYEAALAYRLLAYAAFGEPDPEAAVGYFEKAVEQAALPLDDEISMRFNIAQIYASLDEWAKVESTLREWFRYVEKPNAQAYYLLAISHFQREQYDQALPPALRALELADEPRESWLQLVAALHLQKEDFESAVPILEELVSRFPNKQYWTQLSLIYGANGNYQNSFRIQQLAYAQGLVTEQHELLRLARSHLYHGLPFPAAKVLERGLEEGRIEPDRDSLELLGNCWIAAREYDRSLEPLQRAAELSDDGKLYLRLAQVRVQRESWKEATRLIQQALAKGGLDDTGKAQLLLGIAYYSDGQTGAARTAFGRALDHDSTRTEAKAWLEHIARQDSAG